MPETILVTGASSGIGRELARLAAADGHELILVARREERLHELALDLKTRYGTMSLVIAEDLTRAGGAARVMDAIMAAEKSVDVLINNAGFGQLGRFQEIPLERQLDMIQLNIQALVELTYRVLPGMISRKHGRILNLGSTAAFQPGPHCAVYYATKAFVLSFSEAISQELKQTGVTVSCLCPGPTRTEFGESSRMHDTPVFKHNAMNVEQVAREGYRGLFKGKRLIIPGAVNRALATGVRFSPRGFMLKLMSRLQPLQD